MICMCPIVRIHMNQPPLKKYVWTAVRYFNDVITVSNLFSAKWFTPPKKKTSWSIFFSTNVIAGNEDNEITGIQQMLKISYLGLQQLIDSHYKGLR